MDPAHRTETTLNLGDTFKSGAVYEDDDLFQELWMSLKQESTPGLHQPAVCIFFNYSIQCVLFFVSSFQFIF